MAVRNPYQQIAIDYDVREFASVGAAGIYFEFMPPGREFSTPNGNTPDPSRLIWSGQTGLTGRFYILPARNLPGWGTYSMRVIPLDRTGMRAVGKFSDSSKLILSPP